MKRKYFPLALITYLFLIMIFTISCGGGGDGGGSTPSSTKDITSFTILGIPGTVGVNTVAITVPYGTDPSSLTPTIVHTGASVSPASGVAQDFRTPQTYTITAADSTTKTYMVTVTVSALWTGTKQLGTASADSGHSVGVDAGGNVYIAGIAAGDLDGSISAGYEDMFLVKYDASGTKLWTRLLGTVQSEQALGVAVDASGNAYVTGRTLGDLDGNISAGGQDMFLVKYNTTGTKQWTRQLGTSSSDIGYGVAVDASGNVYVTGHTRGDLDGNVNAGGGNIDVFLVKYDTTGTKQWTRQFGTSSADTGYGVAVDTSGNVYVTGQTDSGLFGNISAGSSDIFLVKYDALGARQWIRQLGTASADIGNGVVVDAGGNIYVTGLTLGDLDGNINAGSTADLFLMKYNVTGMKQWTRQLGTGTFDGGYGVAVDASGNAYVTGYTLGDLDGNVSAGYEDMFLVKYDASGTKLWTRLLGTVTDDRAFGVAVDAFGNAYATGYTWGDLDGNVSAGDGDIFLVKYNAIGVKQ